jgi:outer membrane protein assembly factor BamD (BamD/ComL family)
MKTGASLKRHSLPVFALLFALLPALCSCVSMAQRGAVDLAYRSYNKGDYAKALRHLAQAEAYHEEMSNERHAEILLLKGRCVEGMGNRAEAASLYEYLVKTYPDTEYAARAKGRLEELRKAP